MFGNWLGSRCSLSTQAKNVLTHYTTDKLFGVMPSDPAVLSELLSGKFVAYEKDGVGVIVFRNIYHHDSSAKSAQPVLRTFVYLLMALTASAAVQRNGVVVIYDMSKSAWAHFNRALTDRLAALLEDAVMPARLVKALVLNCPMSVRAYGYSFGSKMQHVSTLKQHVAATMYPAFMGGEWVFPEATAKAYLQALMHTRPDSGSVIYRRYKNAKRVTLAKGPGGFGFGILGPPDTATDDTPGSQQPRDGIYISSSRHESVTVGWRLLQVNGADLKRATKQECVDIIRQSGKTIALIIAAPLPVEAPAPPRPPPAQQRPPNHSPPLHAQAQASLPSPEGAPASPTRRRSKHGQRDVVISRTPAEAGQRLGMNMRSYHGVQGTWISGITPSGVIGRTNDVQVGDVIFAINGKPMLDAPHQDVLAELKRCGATFTLTVAKKVPADVSTPLAGVAGAQQARPLPSSSPQQRSPGAKSISGANPVRRSSSPIEDIASHRIEYAFSVLRNVERLLNQIGVDLNKTEMDVASGVTGLPNAGPLGDTATRNEAWSIVRRCQGDLDAIVTSELQDAKAQVQAKRRALVAQCAHLETRFETFTSQGSGAGGAAAAVREDRGGGPQQPQGGQHAPPDALQEVKAADTPSTSVVPRASGSDIYAEAVLAAPRISSPDVPAQEGGKDGAAMASDDVAPAVAVAVADDARTAPAVARAPEPAATPTSPAAPAAQQNTPEPATVGLAPKPARPLVSGVDNAESSTDDDGLSFPMLKQASVFFRALEQQGFGASDICVLAKHEITTVDVAAACSVHELVAAGLDVDVAEKLLGALRHVPLAGDFADLLAANGVEADDARILENHEVTDTSIFVLLGDELAELGLSPEGLGALGGLREELKELGA